MDIYYSYGIQFPSDSDYIIGFGLEVFLAIGFVSIIMMGITIFIRRRKTDIRTTN